LACHASADGENHLERLEVLVQTPIKALWRKRVGVEHEAGTVLRLIRIRVAASV